MNLDPNMNTRTKFCLTAAGAAAAAVGSSASAEIVTITIDLSGDYYAFGNENALSWSSSDASWASAIMVSSSISGVQWVAGDNSGAGAPFSAYTSELTFTAASAFGYGIIGGGGKVGGGAYGGAASQTSPNFTDLSYPSSPYLVDSTGSITLTAFNSWNDGTGLSMGNISAGTFTLVIDTLEVPSPGALALLGFAGLTASRRRRNA